MTNGQKQSLIQALRKAFPGTVDAEQIHRKGRYRFAVASKRFAKMPQLKRQDAVWKVVGETLPREALLDISLILTFDPKDLRID